MELLLSESEILIDEKQGEVSEVIIGIYDSNLEEKREKLYKKQQISTTTWRKSAKKVEKVKEK